MGPLLSLLLIITASPGDFGQRLPTPPPDCREYLDTFFRLPRTERLARFEAYDAATQYVLVLCGNQRIHPPMMELADRFSMKGQAAIPLLTAGLNSADDDLTVRDITLILEIMAVKDRYDVRGDTSLVTLLRSRITAMNDKGWRSHTQRMLRIIEEPSRVGERPNPNP